MGQKEENGKYIIVTVVLVFAPVVRTQSYVEFHLNKLSLSSSLSLLLAIYIIYIWPFAPSFSSNGWSKFDLNLIAFLIDYLITRN